MTQNEIKSELLRILAKIDGQIIGAWGSTLENTTEAVILENSEQIPYNFWLHDLQNLLKRLDNAGPMEDKEGEKYARKCSKCGKGMNYGFVYEGGCEYYCSDECLNSEFTPQEWAELVRDLEGENYWTEWEDEGEYQYQIINGILEEIDQ
jgi:hypothetical protein